MPSPWLHHFWNLLLRSWDSLVSYLGTTTFGILFSVALLGCTLAYSFRSTLRRNHAKVTVAALKDAVHQAFRPMLASMAIVVLGWFILFSVFVARTVYEDHDTLVSVNNRLRHVAQNNSYQLTKDPKDSPPKLELTLPPLLEQYLKNRTKEDAGFESQRTAILAEVPPGARPISFAQRIVTPSHPEYPYNLQVSVPKLYTDDPQVVLMIECETDVGRIETIRPTSEAGRTDDRHKTVGIVGFPLQSAGKSVIVSVQSKQRNRVLRVSQLEIP